MRKARPASESVQRREYFRSFRKVLTAALNGILERRGETPLKRRLNLKDAKEIYTLVLHSVFDEVTKYGGRWTLPKGLGTFIVKTVRVGRRRNPNTGEVLTIPDTMRLRYREGSKVKRRLRTGKKK